MKTGNVILAIFLWLCIPASLLLGLVFGIGATIGGATGSQSLLCCLSVPIVLFIIGLVVLLMGREKPTIHVTQTNQRFCPKCGRSIPMDAQICPYCRNDFQS